MMQQAAHSLRQMVTVVLAVSLSMCCCQAHFLLHGLSAADGSAALGTLDAVPACCPGCVDEDPSAPRDELPGQPERGCQVCCIKGTGQRDTGPVLLDAGPAVAPVFVSATHLEPLPPVDRGHLPPVDVATLRVEPRTLVRLRCALIV